MQARFTKSNKKAEEIARESKGPIVLIDTAKIKLSKIKKELMEKNKDIEIFEFDFINCYENFKYIPIAVNKAELPTGRFLDIFRKYYATYNHKEDEMDDRILQAFAISKFVKDDIKYTYTTDTKFDKILRSDNYFVFIGLKKSEDDYYYNLQGNYVNMFFEFMLMKGARDIDFILNNYNNYEEYIKIDHPICQYNNFYVIEGKKKKFEDFEFCDSNFIDYF